MDEKIFISYSRKDKDVVFSIRDEIQKRLHLNCWIDLNGIESDQQFVDVIISAINQSDIFLFMYSKNSSTSEWTKKELGFAEEKKKKIVFIKIDDAPLTDWFSFNFRGHDIINFQNVEQRNKLFFNLCQWCSNEENSVKLNSASDFVIETSTIIHVKQNLRKIFVAFAVLGIVAIIIGTELRVNGKRQNESVINDCNAQLYLMRYSLLNSLHNDVFSNAQLNEFLYKDSLDCNGNCFVFPCLSSLSINGSATHNPILQLKLHSSHKKTLVFTQLSLEVKDFERLVQKDMVEIDSLSHKMLLDDISKIMINDNGLYAVEHYNSTTGGPKSGFSHSLVFGETDAQTYFSIVSSSSCRMKIRAVLTDVNGSVLYSPYISLEYLKMSMP